MTSQFLKRIQFIVVIGVAMSSPTVLMSTLNAGEKTSDGLRQTAVETLRNVGRNESGWVKVHAAEFSLELGHDVQSTLEMFEKEADLRGGEAPYRIGVWRVLAKGTLDPKRQREWTDKIRQAFLDVDGTDRLHAVETLCKLGHRPTEEERDALRDFVGSHPSTEAVYGQWALAIDGDAAELDKLLAYVDADEPLTRLRAAAALGYFGELSDERWRRLSNAALGEAENSDARVHLLAAAWVNAPKDAGADEIREALLQSLKSDKPGERKYAAFAFAKRGGLDVIPSLRPLLEDEDPDVRAFAAYGVLRALRRTPKVISVLDWVVIGLYFLGMLLIGWYFSRRSNTAEDYLLGGRNQRAWAVGLSLFATLLSTLSYMAYPGEIIKHGPMILAGLFAYPVIFVIVGFVFIPMIMRLRVTSAYEILESRLGLGVRMAGSGVFILIRLAWMAAIIYVTSAAIIVPVLGVAPEYAPLIGLVIGVVTLAYTSLGGLRAVIWTDVVQTFILFFGAFLTLLLITVHFGGFGWFPANWAVNWDPPVLWFSSTARTTLAGSFMMMLGWFVCTSGSDQMAIQRYLATRDARSARGMFAVSLTTSLIVAVLLMFMGFALLAFFQANPQFLPDGRTIQTSADILFPRYIVFGLPQGVSGLVVAGLLAAAMSSLSSGVNSAATVVQVDFLERFSKTKHDEREAVRMGKWVTVGVGVAVVLISLSIGQVKGNLLEVVNKVGNLLTAPLFLLFFMALFVPWARSAATLVALAASVSTAVAIAYFEIFGLSFIWIIPSSLGVGAAVGAVLSLIPLGPTAKQRLEGGSGDS